jgi:hypothetical protein
VFIGKGVEVEAFVFIMKGGALWKVIYSKYWLVLDGQKKKCCEKQALVMSIQKNAKFGINFYYLLFLYGG